MKVYKGEKVFCPNGCGKKFYVLPNRRHRNMEAHLTKCGGTFSLSTEDRDKLKEFKKKLKEREVGSNGE
jgi:hypothetical protein